MKRIDWGWFVRGWFTRPEVGALESFLLRLALALIVAYTLRLPVTQNVEPHPVGLLRLLHWFDDQRLWLTWLADKDAAGVYANFEAYRGVIYGLLALYAAGLALPVVLPVLSVMHILPFTLFCSQGYTHHGNQIVSMLLVVQAGCVLWNCARKRQFDFAPPDAVLRGWLLWQSVTLVAGSYFLSVITKLKESNGMWLWNSNNFALDMIKTQRQSWLNKLSPDLAGIPDAALWMLQHPWTARLTFGSGMILEAVCILAIGNRILGFLLGISLIVMHRSIDALMGGVVFPYNELLDLVFLVGIPFGIAWILEKLLPKPLCWGAVIGALAGLPLSWMVRTPGVHSQTVGDHLQALVNFLDVWGNQNWGDFLNYMWPEVIAVCALTTAAGIGIAWWISRKTMDSADGPAGLTRPSS